MANTTISALEADLRLFLNHVVYRKVDGVEEDGELVRLSLSGELNYELAMIVKEGGIAVAIPFSQILELSLVGQYESVRWFRTDADFEREAFEHDFEYSEYEYAEIDSEEYDEYSEYSEYSEDSEDGDPVP